MRRVRTVAEERRPIHTTLKLYSSYPKTLAGGEFPFEVSVKSTNVYSSWDIDTLSEVIDVFEWTLDTVKDGAHDSWSKLHREGFTCPKDRVTNRHTSFIVTLGETNKDASRHLKYVFCNMSIRGKVVVKPQRKAMRQQEGYKSPRTPGSLPCLPPNG